MDGPYWPKPSEPDWERARESRRQWEEDQARQAAERAEEERKQREWNRQYREDQKHVER